VNTNRFFIPAGLFIGLGIGLAIDKAAAGVFIGFGGGFLLSALSSSFRKKS
jgi:hypothetical protein